MLNQYANNILNYAVIFIASYNTNSYYIIITLLYNNTIIITLYFNIFIIYTAQLSIIVIKTIIVIECNYIIFDILLQ